MDARPRSSASIALRCVSTRDETPSIRTFRLRPPGAPVAFVPGQALVLRVPLPDGPVWRSFTISGETGGDLEVTIKARAAGGATRWLRDNLTEGVAIDARAPRGVFTLALRGNERLAFVSGGSGATPMIAMLRRLAATDPAADVAWFHAAHDPDEVLFAGELAGLQERMPGLAVSVAVSRPAPGWFGHKGRISRRMVAAALADFGRREVFCCGPEGFMREARMIHRAEGGDVAQFHTESFGAAVPVAAAVEPPPGGPVFGLRVNGRAIAIAPTETVLQASLRQGIVIPCGCGQGMCGTCMVRLVSGDVVATPNGGLTPEDAAEGYILACSTRATSDIEIARD